jgi:hypothetical protein
LLKLRLRLRKPLLPPLTLLLLPLLTLLRLLLTLLRLLLLRLTLLLPLPPSNSGTGNEKPAFGPVFFTPADTV